MVPSDDRCFVIGPIGDQLADPGTDARLAYEEALAVYEEVIRPACEAVGLRPTRADEISESGEIPEQIFEALRDCPFVVADLSGANANVMYELGIRHAVGRCTVQIGEKGRLPFDVSTIRTFQFRRTTKGLIDVRKALTGALQYALENGCRPTTAGRVLAEGSTVVFHQAQAVNPIATAPEVVSDADVYVVDEPLGLVDIVAEIEDGMPDLNARMISLGETVREIGEVMRDHGDRFSDAKKSSHRIPLLAAFASDMTPIARRFDDETIEMQARVKSLDLAVVGLISLIESGEQEVDVGLLDTIAEIASAAKQSRDEGVASFRSSAAGLQNLSRSTRPVFRLLVQTTDRTTDALTTITGWGESAERAKRALATDDGVD